MSVPYPHPVQRDIDECRLKSDVVGLARIFATFDPRALQDQDREDAARTVYDRAAKYGPPDWDPMFNRHGRRVPIKEAITAFASRILNEMLDHMPPPLSVL